jgi:hypothetical protein
VLVTVLEVEDEGGPVVLVPELELVLELELGPDAEVDPKAEEAFRSVGEVVERGAAAAIPGTKAEEPPTMFVCMEEVIKFTFVFVIAFVAPPATKPCCTCPCP